MDSGLGHVRFTFTRSAYEQPAVLSAGRNLEIAASGAIDNAASLINAGAAATIRAASRANSAAQNTYDLYIKAGEWSRYTVYSPAAAALQAGSSLNVEVSGWVVNTGNVPGTHAPGTQAEPKCRQRTPARLADLDVVGRHRNPCRPRGPQTRGIIVPNGRRRGGP